jgi:hypothetical protein
LATDFAGFDLANFFGCFFNLFFGDFFFDFASATSFLISLEFDSFSALASEVGLDLLEVSSPFIATRLTEI